MNDEMDDYDDVGEQGEDPGPYRFADPGGEDTTNIEFLTKMWGSTTPIQVVDVTVTGIGVSGQIADVRMPEPLVCSVFLQAAFLSGAGTVNNLTWTLQIGLGRTTVNRTLSFLGQPSPGNDLVVVLTHVPLFNLLGQVTIGGFADAGSPERVGGLPAFTLGISVEVAPITRAKIEAQYRTFGMSSGDEANAMDEEMQQGDFLPEPTARDIVTQGHTVPMRSPGARLAARRALAPQRPPPPQGDPKRRAFIEQVIQILTQHLGRRPNKQEVRAALQSFEVPR